MEWLLRNCGESNDASKINHSFSYSNDSCYLNSITERSREAVGIDHTFAIHRFRNVIVTHEDVSDDYVSDFSLGYRKVVIMRDIVNVLASRLKLLENRARKGKTGKSLVDISENTFKVWQRLSTSQQRGCIIVKFEDWVSSKDYRDSICSKLNIANIDKTDTVTHYGGGSSFTGMTKTPTADELNSRASAIEFPAAIQERLEMQDIVLARRNLGYIE